MDKIKPKFSSLSEIQFWQDVYVASLSAGNGGLISASAADKAIERRTVRMTDELLEQEL